MAAGVYIHIPFCKSRCSYCDFATDIYRDAKPVERYIDALCREISNWTPPEGRTQRVDTIYFGGGTPSLLTPGQLARIIEQIDQKFEIASGAEITLEMNPATVTPESLAGYQGLGINRASFGVQTFDDRALKLLARGHDAADARQTFLMLREAGFDNVSFDLIAGLPGQTLDDWQANLAAAIEMQPEHLSLYLLEIHNGTPLAEQVRSGRQPKPDDDLATEMYEMMLDRLGESGYEQYEISNFSKPGFESHHNTKYWRLDPVYSFGVSAHSFDGRERYANERQTDTYIELVEAGQRPESMRESVALASEFIFLGLRLEAGISFGEYRSRFGRALEDEYAPELARFAHLGLVEIGDERLRLTRRGKLLSNEIFAAFV